MRPRSPGPTPATTRRPIATATRLRPLSAPARRPSWSFEGPVDADHRHPQGQRARARARGRGRARRCTTSCPSAGARGSRADRQREHRLVHERHCFGAPAQNSGSIGPLERVARRVRLCLTVGTAGPRSFKAHYEGSGRTSPPTAPASRSTSSTRTSRSRRAASTTSVRPTRSRRT